MSRKSILMFAAAAALGIASVSAVATDAMAYRGGVAVGPRGGAVAWRGGVYRGGVYRRPGVVAGAVAASRARCGYYPYPPCY
jgi:hypothetical protein